MNYRKTVIKRKAEMPEFRLETTFLAVLPGKIIAFSGQLYFAPCLLKGRNIYREAQNRNFISWLKKTSEMNKNIALRENKIFTGRYNA